MDNMEKEKPASRSIDEMRKRRRPLFVSTEEVLMKYLQQTGAKPDGSFIEGEWMAGFEAGRRFARKRQKKAEGK